MRIGAKYRLDQIENADWRKAEGITEEAKKDTNSMLATRDYDVKCKTGSEPLMVVNGVHIWYCDTHHQPESHCINARLRNHALVFAEAVRKNDKTKPYQYGGYGYKGDSENNDGEAPQPYQRWLTPMEMALNFIRDLTR